MIVNVSDVSPTAIIAFEVSIAGVASHRRTDILGYPVFQRHRMASGAVVVEIEAFLVAESSDTNEGGTR